MMSVRKDERNEFVKITRNACTSCVVNTCNCLINRQISVFEFFTV